MIRVTIEVDHGHGTVHVEELGSIHQHDNEDAALRALRGVVARAEKRTACALVAREQT